MITSRRSFIKTMMATSIGLAMAPLTTLDKAVEVTAWSSGTTHVVDSLVYRMGELGRWGGGRFIVAGNRSGATDASLHHLQKAIMERIKEK